LPKNMHRAFLLAQECDFFLEQLEKHNFNPFELEVRQPSYVYVPYNMYKAARANKF